MHLQEAGSNELMHSSSLPVMYGTFEADRVSDHACKQLLECPHCEELYVCALAVQ